MWALIITGAIFLVVVGLLALSGRTDKTDDWGTGGFGSGGGG
ncbi:hypothetical protein [Nocardioides taihuensis]|jgi:hypothetical protein|uniref:Protein-export membrane protein SecG n=1 Tax=Nocardioides taihuensis TaxID=1835606 RepID=A0ABW0BIH7_9ACTN